MGKCVLEVWESVFGCGGRCKEVLGEMWGVGKCVGVWGEVWKSVGEGVGKI